MHQRWFGELRSDVPGCRGTGQGIKHGLVGMDAVCVLAERGVKVTVVEVAEHIMPLQLDQRAAECLVASVILDAHDNVKGLKLKSGRIVPCGMVVAVGVKSPTLIFSKAHRWK